MKVVILACNKYTWLVPIFLHFYKKYWPDNPYQTEIVTETGYIDGTVFYNEETSWSNRLLNYLKQSKENKFLLVMEEHFIDKLVDNQRVEDAEKLCSGNIGCVRLNAIDRWFCKYAVETNIKNFKEYPLDKSYSMSMQTSIWQKQYLLDVLRENEDIWQTEIDGSERLKELKSKWRILWPKSAIIGYEAGGIMKKGRLWMPIVKWALGDLVNEARRQQ